MIKSTFGARGNRRAGGQSGDSRPLTRQDEQRARVYAACAHAGPGSAELGREFVTKLLAALDETRREYAELKRTVAGEMAVSGLTAARQRPAAARSPRAGARTLPSASEALVLPLEPRR